MYVTDTVSGYKKYITDAVSMNKKSQIQYLSMKNTSQIQFLSFPKETGLFAGRVLNSSTLSEAVFFNTLQPC